jgi:hypothetical protein
MPEVTRMILKTIILLVGLGFGVMMLYVGVTQFFAQRALTAHPQRIRVEIVHSQVKGSKSSDTDSRPLRDNSTTSYTPEVRFRYTVDGKTYESDLLRPTMIQTGHASQQSAADEIAAFPVGAQIEAFYNPLLPDKAFLLNEPSSGPVVFMIVGLVVPAAVALVVKFLI